MGLHVRPDEAQVIEDRVLQLLHMISRGRRDQEGALAEPHGEVLLDGLHGHPIHQVNLVHRKEGGHVDPVPEQGIDEVVLSGTAPDQDMGIHQPVFCHDGPDLLVVHADIPDGTDMHPAD